MSQACDLCKGACCETMTLVLKEDTETYKWIVLYGTPTDRGVIFDTPCKMLAKDGRCRIHKTRPKICSQFRVGSKACRRAVTDRRYNKDKIFKAMKEK